MGAAGKRPGQGLQRLGREAGVRSSRGGWQRALGTCSPWGHLAGPCGWGGGAGVLCGRPARALRPKTGVRRVPSPFSRGIPLNSQAPKPGAVGAALTLGRSQGRLAPLPPLLWLEPLGAGSEGSALSPKGRRGCGWPPGCPSSAPPAPSHLWLLPGPQGPAFGVGGREGPRSGAESAASDSRCPPRPPATPPGVGVGVGSWPCPQAARGRGTHLPGVAARGWGSVRRHAGVSARRLPGLARGTRPELRCGRRRQRSRTHSPAAGNRPAPPPYSS